MRLIPQKRLPAFVTRRIVLGIVERWYSDAYGMAGVLGLGRKWVEDERKRLAYERRVMRAIAEGRVKIVKGRVTRAKR